MSAVRRGFLCLALLCAWRGAARADGTPGVLLDLGFTPAARAQIAVWIEREDGRFLQTLSLTDAVAFRGIGNRPGASQMNSGYHWPYGRREGVLPIWAMRRAAAPGAKQFTRVIFQDRISEGLASQTRKDQSIDDYFCLSFAKTTTTRDALDAVSCASRFTSDKGRFITTADVSAGYSEPWEDPVTHMGSDALLPFESLYPPRMDVMTRCADGSTCFDRADVLQFAAHARDVMPDIDAVTTATPPGDTPQSWLFDLPPEWPRGKYVLWLEVNVEGDYNSSYDGTTLPTPTQPSGKWDSWAITFGYPYRGQPSIAYAVPFEVSDVDDVIYTSRTPEGSSSWDTWSSGYGELEAVSNITDDGAGAPGSGADRLRQDAEGDRVKLHVETLTQLPDAGPDPIPPVELGNDNSPSQDPDAAQGGDSAEGPPAELADAGASDPTLDGGMTAEPEPPTPQPDADSDAVILLPAHQEELDDGAVGAVHALRLGRHSNDLHAHEWITIAFAAVKSEQPLHGYEVRVAMRPIVDEASFIREGRSAKTATASAEGAVALMLPTAARTGALVQGEIGDLVAQTHYYVAVRAVDRLNRHGPISVAQITTPRRTFATVTPCFVATAAYGSPLAAEVSALRRLRDRQLQTNAFGRALVHAYYERGAVLARELRDRPLLRRAARALLSPIVAVAQRLAASE